MESTNMKIDPMEAHRHNWKLVVAQLKQSATHRTCAMCGVNLIGRNELVITNRHQFCTSKCHSKFYWPMTKIACTCGKSISVQNAHLFKQTFFCSVECLRDSIEPEIRKKKQTQRYINDTRKLLLQHRLPHTFARG